MVRRIWQIAFSSAILCVGLSAQNVGAEEKDKAPFQPYIDGNNQVLAISDAEKPILAKTDKFHTYEQMLHIENLQEADLPLSLVFENGSADAPGFDDITVYVPGMSAITKEEFIDGKTATVDVTGDLNDGNNQILVSARGQKGAMLTWRLITPKISVTAAHPKMVSLGDQVILVGENLCPDTSVYTVMFGDIPGQVTNATTRQLTVTVPKTVVPGPVKVSVTDYKQTVEGPEIMVNGIPVITGLNITAGKPGQRFTIQGRHFAESFERNTVLVAGIPARVESATRNEIVAIIPEVEYPRYADVTVRIGEGPLSNSMTIRLENGAGRMK